VDTPDHLTFVHVALAYCLACQGETEAARQELSRVSELCRGEAPAVELLYLTGRTYDRLGRPAPTREVFRRALGLYPSHPWAVEMRAWLERGGDDLADSAGG
jgi:Flp pilus assembly protein TadD